VNRARVFSRSVPNHTVIYPVLTSLSVHSGPETVRLTVYVPALCKRKYGFLVRRSMVPSFWKSHAHEVTVPVDRSENFTRSGGFPASGLAEKSARGPGVPTISPDTVRVFPARTGSAGRERRMTVMMASAGNPIHVLIESQLPRYCDISAVLISRL
jgi:hypothetical protein